MKKIGIIGSRRRSTIQDYNQLEKEFFKIYEKGDVIVSGGCSVGGDRFAEIIRDKYSIPMIIHYPDKTKLESNSKWAYAGINFSRNTLIAEDSDVIIALVAKDRTGGTEDTVSKAKKLGKQIILLFELDSLLF